MYMYNAMYVNIVDLLYNSTATEPLIYTVQCSCSFEFVFMLFISMVVVHCTSHFDTSTRDIFISPLEQCILCYCGLSVTQN